MANDMCRTHFPTTAVNSNPISCRSIPFCGYINRPAPSGGHYSPIFVVGATTTHICHVGAVETS